MKITPDDVEEQDRVSLDKALDTGEEDPDSLYKREILALQRDSDVQRLSNRVSFLFVLIPSLLCAVFVFAYIDLRGKLAELQNSGAKEVQALSADVVEKVTSLSEQQKGFEQAQAERLAALEKAAAGFKEGFAGVEKKVNALEVSKADSKALEAMGSKTREDVTAQLEPLKKQVSLQQASVDGLAKKFETELKEGANAIAAFQSDLRIQGEKMADVSEALERLQKKALELDLGIRKLAENQVDGASWSERLGEQKQIVGKIENKLASLADEIAWLQTQLNLKKPKGPDSGASKTGSTDQAAGADAAPSGQSNRIMEQDIKE